MTSLTIKEIEDIKQITDQLNDSISSLQSSLSKIQEPLYDILKKVYSIGEIKNIRIYDEKIEFVWEAEVRGEHCVSYEKIPISACTSVEKLNKYYTNG